MTLSTNNRRPVSSNYPHKKKGLKWSNYVQTCPIIFGGVAFKYTENIWLVKKKRKPEKPVQKILGHGTVNTK